MKHLPRDSKAKLNTYKRFIQGPEKKGMGRRGGRRTKIPYTKSKFPCSNSIRQMMDIFRKWGNNLRRQKLF